MHSLQRKRERTRRRQAGERDPSVLSDAEHLSLIEGELGGELVDGDEDGLGAGTELDVGV